MVVRDGEPFDALCVKVREHFGKLDVLVHSIAFAPKDELGGRFVDTSRSGCRIALDVSCYSLVALAKRARPLMTDGGAMVTMTYFGAEKGTPNYNVRGVAKAALEASVR